MGEQRARANHHIRWKGQAIQDIERYVNEDGADRAEEQADSPRR